MINVRLPHDLSIRKERGAGARAGMTTTLCSLTQDSTRLSPTCTASGAYTWSGNTGKKTHQSAPPVRTIHAAVP